MWKKKLLKKFNRKKIQVTFNPHVFERVEYWRLDLGNVEETVRTGKISEAKCKPPNKICFERYFGKENITYVVIARYHKHFIEVKTAWLRKGR